MGLRGLDAGRGGPCHSGGRISRAIGGEKAGQGGGFGRNVAAVGASIVGAGVCASGPSEAGSSKVIVPARLSGRDDSLGRFIPLLRAPHLKRAVQQPVNNGKEESGRQATHQNAGQALDRAHKLPTLG